MECPHCGSLNNKVIDSRLYKDRISIRRRRQCSFCRQRFTTYESTEEGILSLLIKKKAGYTASKTNLKMMLSFIADTLKRLSVQTEKLKAKVDLFEKVQPALKLKRKAGIRVSAGAKARPSKPGCGKPAAVTDTETVLKVLRRYKTGVGISTLQAKTGFGDKKIQNIVYRGIQKGKIRRISRGIFLAN